MLEGHYHVLQTISLKHTARDETSDVSSLFFRLPLLLSFQFPRQNTPHRIVGSCFSAAGGNRSRVAKDYSSFHSSSPKHSRPRLAASSCLGTRGSAFRFPPAMRLVSKIPSFMLEIFDTMPQEEIEPPTPCASSSPAKNIKMNWMKLVLRPGLEPGTLGSSNQCSTNWATWANYILF